MRVIRVGFPFAFKDHSWLGGLNYYRSLLSAIVTSGSGTVEPVLLADTAPAAEILAGFPPLEVIVSPTLRPNGIGPVVRRRLGAKIIGRDFALEKVARDNRIDVISHQGFFAGLKGIPTLGWIPDFQELHLPHFFSTNELRARSRKIQFFCEHATRILVSSESAKHDLESVNAVCAHKSGILRFVSSVPSQFSTVNELEGRYEIAGPFFHLPNQYWVHKNHEVVIDALSTLKTQGREMLVIATGNERDYRQPQHFADLIRYAEHKGVRGLFRNLGVVPQQDLYGLMSASVAVINPSTFEGWSTTVEEAKSLGKKILLSAIPVHQEQAPDRGNFFSPFDGMALAELMKDAFDTYSPKEEAKWSLLARDAFQGRQKAFADCYENIVLDLVG